MIALYRLYEVIDVECELSVMVISGSNILMNGAVWLDVNAVTPSGNTLALLEGTDN